MYGPTKGDMQFIGALALIGAVAIVATVIIGGVWMFQHISFQ